MSQRHRRDIPVNGDEDIAATVCRSANSRLVVILQAQVGDELFAAQMAQGILQLHELGEEVMLRIEIGGTHGNQKIEREPFLDASVLQCAAALCHIEAEHDVEDESRRQD